MGANSKPAEAAAAEESSDTPAGAGDFSPKTMANVFARLGQKAPAAIIEAGKEPAEGAAEGDEGKQAAATTEAEQAAAAAAEASPEGDEAEAAAAATEADKASAEAGAEAETVVTDEQAKKLSEENSKILHAKLKDLPEATRKTVQSFMDERIAAISGKAKSENDRLGTRVTELTGEIETLRKEGPVPVVIPGIHPALLADTPEQIDQEVQKIETFEDWADQYRAGFNLPESETYDPKQPTWTAEQIRARSRELQREKDRILPQARQKLADRTKADEQLKTVLPSLFDPKTSEYAQAQSLLKAQPHLRVRADQNVILAQLILGQKALQQLQNPGRKPGNASPNAGKSTAPAAKPPLRKAPRAPGDGAPAFGSPLDSPTNQRPAPEKVVSNFTKNRTRDGLKTAVRELGLFRN